MTAVSVSAATQFSDGEYTFEKTQSGSATIVACDLTEDTIEIPASVLGYPVTGIGSCAFLNNSCIRSVSLPESVTAVGEYAFAENEGLETVTIPRLCSSIAANVFLNSPNVTVRCWYGSAADGYSRENHIPCEYLDNVPVGDANGDGELTINDVTAIQLHLAELEPFEGISLLAADVDKNGTIEISDGTAMQMYLAAYEMPYPFGEPIRAENTPNTGQ